MPGLSIWASCRATRTFPKKPTIKASGVRRRFVLPQRGAWPLNLGIVPRDQELPGLSIWASCRRPEPPQSPLSSSERHSSCYARAHAARPGPSRAPVIKASGVREDVSFFLNEVPGLSIWASCRATRRCLASQSGHRAARPGPSQSPLSSSDRHSSCYAHARARTRPKLELGRDGAPKFSHRCLLSFFRLGHTQFSQPISCTSSRRR